MRVRVEHDLALILTLLGLALVAFALLAVGRWRGGHAWRWAARGVAAAGLLYGAASWIMQGDQLSGFLNESDAARHVRPYLWATLPLLGILVLSLFPATRGRARTSPAAVPPPNEVRP